MRIGIITFHCSYNYGSALQAYALQRFLISQGYETETISYYSKDFDQYKLFRPAKYKTGMKYALYDLIYIGRHIKRKRSFRNFVADNLIVSEEEYNDGNIAQANQRYDCFICGSDQIWNTDCTRGVVPAFFLEFADEGKPRIAYAPSIAHDRISNDYIDAFRSAVNKIDYLSVREESGRAILAELTDKEITCAADPTLLLDADDYRQLMKEKAGIPEGKYIFLYMLEWNAETVKYCKKLKERFHLPIYYLINRDTIKTIGLFDKEDKNLYGIDPGQFLTCLAGSRFVVTNSFHATVFSIIFHKQFCSFCTRHSYSRTVDLLNNLGLSNRINDNLSDIGEEIDYSSVDRKKSDNISKSKDFLLNALSCVPE